MNGRRRATIEPRNVGTHVLWIRVYARQALPVALLDLTFASSPVKWLIKSSSYRTVTVNSALRHA